MHPKFIISKAKSTILSYEMYTQVGGLKKNKPQKQRWGHKKGETGHLVIHFFVL